MSFVHADNLDLVASTETDLHKTYKVSPLANREKLQQVMNCTQRFAE